MMKVLRIIVGFILIVVSLFISIALIWPTFTYQSNVTVEATVDHSWKIFTNTNLMPEWMEGFKSMKTLSSEPGQIGSQYELIIEGNGSEIHLFETVTHYDVNELYGMQIEADVLSNEALIYFEQVGNNTIITAKNKVSGKGILWKSMLLLMKSTFQKTSDEQYMKLKEVIESQK